MLPAQHRLRKEKDIERLVRQKSGRFDPVCGVKLLPNNLPDSRFAFIVPNRVTKSAVKRNAVRRQYREIVRLHLPEIVPGYDVLLLISKPALDLDYREKERRLLHVFGRVGLLRAGSREQTARHLANIGVPKNPVA